MPYSWDAQYVGRDLPVALKGRVGRSHDIKIFGAAGRTCQNMHSFFVLRCAIWARVGMQGTSTYTVKRIFNKFINKYMFCTFVVGRSFLLVRFISSSHAEKSVSTPVL